ncbi:MAG: Maf family protein, partial [Chitinophagales bacterium]|nr:Maf family protein [Chitinophagales bacterium]
MKKIILASKSPRRQELLKTLGLDYTLLLPDADESYPKDLKLRLVPEYLSAKKAEGIKMKLQADEVIIA